MAMMPALNRTSGDVENGRDKCLDVMLVAANDAERQRRHHDNQAADDHWGRLAYRTCQ